MPGPLTGYRVIELAGIGPGPYAGQILADMGAEVISVDRPGGAGPLGSLPMVHNRGKKSLVLDLRKEGSADILLKLVASADILIEGNRPGVTEKLGIGPEACLAVNPKLVYGRMTGWGQTGPWANMAGHDINYLSITGALHAMGENGRPPSPPLNLVGDYGGGSMILVIGVLSALLKAQSSGQGDVVDAAIIDGVSSMMGIIYSLSALKLWTSQRQSNLLDGSAPFYRCYATQDGKFMAVGCIEPQFFAEFLEKLSVDATVFGAQMDRSQWARQQADLEALFATKTRAHWADLFDGSDACVTPVLTYEEAADHPQNKSRKGLEKTEGMIHPAPMPAFSQDPLETQTAIPVLGQDSEAILNAAGYDADTISDMIKKGWVGTNAP